MPFVPAMQPINVIFNLSLGDALEKCELNVKSDATACARPKAQRGREREREGKEEDGTDTSSRTSLVCIVADGAVSRPQQQIPAHLSTFTVKQPTFELKENNRDWSRSALHISNNLGLRGQKTFSVL